MRELQSKLEKVRRALGESGLTAVRLRGVDWFSWLTCGGSSVVLLSAEVGVAEVLVTATDAIVLTDVIERARLEQEELPKNLGVFARPWASPADTERYVAEHTGGGKVASDRPTGAELPLPRSLLEARWSLEPEERERYRSLGRDAAEAMTEVLREAKPEWTGFQLAGALAEVLYARQIEPTLALIGDERRLPVHRHPTPSRDELGARAMLVTCARRHGLFACFTRFVYFRKPTDQERELVGDVAAIESAVLSASRPGTTLDAAYRTLVEAYARRGHPGGERLHHQGGTCGYLSRDVIARPGDQTPLQPVQALAWNPSLPGAKLEDTVISDSSGIELLTVDPRWPTFEVDGRKRPDLLVR